MTTTRRALYGLVPGADYAIRIRAKSGGISSDWSRKLAFTAATDGALPNAPTGLTWVAIGDSFHAEWDSVTQNENGDDVHVVRYDVELTADSQTRIVSVIQGGTTGKVTYDLTFSRNLALFGNPEPSIDIRVRAVDNWGLTSDWAGPLTATNPAPGPPTNGVVVSSQDSLDISWDAPTDDDLIGYNAYVGTTSGFTPNSGNRIWSGNATGFIYTSTTYSLQYIKIRAVDKFNQESTDLTVSGTPTSPFVIDTTAPATPTGLAATITTATTPGLETSAAVSWNANSESDLAGYFLQYRKNGTTPYTTVRLDKTTTSTVVTGLDPYVNYDFRISAVDWQSNQSAYSSIATGTGATNAAPSTPAAPTSVSTNTMQAQVLLSGNRSTGPAMESDVVYYEVYGSTTTGFTPSSANMLGVIPVGPALIGTFDIPATGGSSTQTWFFKVIAVDNGGLKSSASGQTSGTVGLIAATNIVDATITNAKIADLAVNKLTGGVINTTDINVISKLIMGDSTHTGAIESFGYSAGTTGFHIDKSTFEVNNGSIAAAALKIQVGNNLLPAPYADFEANSGFYASGSGLAFVAGSASLDTTDKMFNTQSLKWTTSSTSNALDMSASQTTHNFVINPDTTYIISAYLMTKTGDTPPVGIRPGLRFKTASSNSTIAVVTGQNVTANSTWTRFTWTLTTDSTPTGMAHLMFTHNTSGAIVYMDGIQVEEKLSSLTTASPWHPPGNTTIDGNLIKTGAIIANTNVTVNGSSIPVWSIPLNGAASFANLQVRGNAVVGVSGGTDGGASNLSSGNYITGTTGWQVKSDGAAEFNSVAVRGIIESGTANKVTIQTTPNPFQSSSSWGVIQFYADDGSNLYPGQIWSNFDSSYSTISIASPYDLTAGASSAARLDLKTNTSADSRAIINADTIELHSESMWLASTDSTDFDFTLVGTNIVSFQQSAFNGDNRFQIDLGNSNEAVIRSRDDTTAVQNMHIVGSTIDLDVTNGGLHVSSGSNIKGRIEPISGGVALSWLGTGSLVVGTSTYNGATPTINNTLDLYARDIYSERYDSDGNGLTGASIGSGGKIQRTTSSKRYKSNIKPMKLDTAKKALGLEAVTFTLREEAKAKNRKTYPGFIAEQAQEAGMELWVNHDIKGRPDGFRYPELTAAHNMLIRDLYQEIEDLKTQLREIKS